MVEESGKGVVKTTRIEAEGVRLDAHAVWHLNDAFEQMDLLLHTRRVDGGLVCLVAMLRDLQMLRLMLRQ